jgi:hypothetical protein
VNNKSSLEGEIIIMRRSAVMIEEEGGRVSNDEPENGS